MERREFIAKLGKAGVGSFLAWLGLAGEGEGSPMIFNLGPAADYPPGTVKFLLFRETYLVSDREGIYALSSICPHNDCNVAWQEREKRFDCPCHRSLFDAEGKLLKGPARRSLTWLKLELDKRKELKLHRNKKGKWGVKIPHSA